MAKPPPTEASEDATAATNDDVRHHNFQSHQKLPTYKDHRRANERPVNTSRRDNPSYLASLILRPTGAVIFSAERVIMMPPATTTSRARRQRCYLPTVADLGSRSGRPAPSPWGGRPDVPRRRRRRRALRPGPSPPRAAAAAFFDRDSSAASALADDVHTRLADKLSSDAAEGVRDQTRECLPRMCVSLVAHRLLTPLSPAHRRGTMEKTVQ